MKKPKFLTTILISLTIFTLLFFLRLKIQPHFQKTGFGYDLSVIKNTNINPAIFLDLGQEKSALGDLEGAIVYYQLGLARFPDNISLLLELGKTYASIEEEGKAIEAFKRVASLVPENVDIRYHLATIFYEQGNYQEALKFIKEVLLLAPKENKYILFAAQISNLNDKYREAHNYFKELSSGYLPSQSLELALTKTLAWEKQMPPKNYSEILLNNAKIALDKNNFFQSKENFYQYELLFGKTKVYQHFLTEHIYLDLIKKNPKDSETYFRLAQFYYQENHVKESLESINAALKIEKTNLAYLQLKAIIANELNLPEEEKNTYLAILALKPKDPMVLKELIILNVLERVNLTKKQIENEPLLFKIATEQYNGEIKNAFATLKEYKAQEGSNPIYYSMLTFLAFKLDKCLLQTIEKQELLEEWVKELSIATTFVKDDSWLLQEKAELVGKALLCEEPCVESSSDLYATTIRLLEDPPLVDFIAARAAYCWILTLDPCNQKALYNLARVTALLKEIDNAAALYKRYLSIFPPERDILIQYADLLEDQGNIGLSLKYICLCERLYGLDTYLKEKKAHIHNSGELSTPAMVIALNLLQENPDNYNGWVNYTNAAGILHYPYRSLYGLQKLYEMEPGNPETKSAQWTVLPQLLSFVNGSGEFYQETTSLTQYFERIDGGDAYSPTFKMTAGMEAFQTYATDTVNSVLGLGDLQGINGEAWGAELSMWVGMHKIISPKLIMDLHFGGADQHVGSIHSGTPTYLLELFMPVCDTLEINFLSSYGFLLKSPRSLSLKIRQERNFLSFNWRPWWGYQLLSTFDGMINTDGNKQLEVYVYPRKTILYKEHWKLDVGLMGTWLTSHQYRLTGYYQPYLFQGYAGELLLDYRVNYFNTLKLTGSLGTQKDNFSTRFGLLANVKMEGLFNITLNWYAYCSGDYYYIDASEGYFSYLDFSGGLTYRF